MRGNGEDGDAKPIKVTVVDRRHHAHAEEEPAATGERSPYPSFVEELRARAEAAERRAREAIAGAEAELDAVRVRLQRDLDRRVAQARSGLLSSVLEVVDNLDRAATVADETSGSVAEGIRLIRSQLLTILRAEGVEPIETIGQPYDPHVAEAVLVEPVEPDRDGVVLEELQRGYRLGETVLRPARVKVGKASAG